jgi:LysM repeat protein
MRSQLISAALAIGVVLTLGACSSGSSGSPSNSTLLTLTPTNFATVATVPSSSTTTVAPAAGSSIPGQSTYTIAAGDFPSTIAAKFHVNLADLLALNGWTLVGQQVTNFPAVGTVIKIPAGATAPAAATPTATTVAGETTVAGATTTTAPGAVTTTTTTTKGTKATTTTTAGSKATTTTTKGTKATTTTAAGGSSTTVAGNCATGSYVITKDDTSRVKVAAKFDVTVAQLDAANTGTKGYNSFAPGLKIVIPKKAGCP